MVQILFGRNLHIVPVVTMSRFLCALLGSDDNNGGLAIQSHLVQRTPFHLFIRSGMPFRRSITPRKGQKYGRQVPLKAAAKSP
jgi:hypothetical protein